MLHRRIAMSITDLFIFIALLQSLIYCVWKNFPFLYHDLAKVKKHFDYYDLSD